jgi:Phage integrase family
LLDYVGVDPNPAKDKRVKLPKRDHEIRIPPSADHFAAIVGAATAKFRLALVTVEQSAVREGELVRIAWGHLDRKNLKVLIPASSSKTKKPRWVQLPEWLFDANEATCPPDDRTPERFVFQGITEATLYQAMRRACAKAGVPHYTVHDLRRRRITVWHHEGVPQKVYMERSGHTRYSVSLDVYTHAMPTEEVPFERLEALNRRVDRCPGVVPVWSRRAKRPANPHGHTKLGLARVVLHDSERSRFRSTKRVVPVALQLKLLPSSHLRIARGEADDREGNEGAARAAPVRPIQEAGR